MGGPRSAVMLALLRPHCAHSAASGCICSYSKCSWCIKKRACSERATSMQLACRSHSQSSRSIPPSLKCLRSRTAVVMFQVVVIQTTAGIRVSDAFCSTAAQQPKPRHAAFRHIGYNLNQADMWCRSHCSVWACMRIRSNGPKRAICFDLTT